MVAVFSNMTNKELVSTVRFHIANQHPLDWNMDIVEELAARVELLDAEVKSLKQTLEDEDIPHDAGVCTRCGETVPEQVE